VTRREFIAGLAGAAAWPVAAPGQQQAMPVIGFLSSLAPEGAVPLVAAFQSGLSASGYVEGKNVAIEYRWARGDYDRLPELARELVTTRAAVLATTGGEPAALAAKAASSSVPVVFMVGGDPVKLGLVASYNQPGGNATGINLLTEAMEPKRLGILRELLPQVPTVAVLVNPKFPPAELQAKEIETAARSFGMQAEVFRATADIEIEAAFQAIADRRIAALIVATDPSFVTRRSHLIALAARHMLPTMYAFREVALSGGLMSYGIDLADAYRQQALYVGRILKGERPADLPVFQPTKFDLVINLKTAKSLDLTFPPSLLAIADEVIE
jgi:putative ABC transport system substrate-binding protein